MNMHNRMVNNVLLGTLVTLFFLAGCKTQKEKLEFISPANNSKVLKGETVDINLRFAGAEIDSVVYAIDGEVFERKTDTTTVSLHSDDYGFGSKRITAKVYAAGEEDIAYSEVLIVPPAATRYGFEVVNTFDHDPGAFTQGLYYDNGVLYESTGREGESTIRRVDLETGEVLQKADMAADEFGEGMTVVGNEAYVLTWKNNKGHVYDKNSFKLLRSFDYQNSKLGWGLTYDGNQFIKSDGSSTLYFLETGEVLQKADMAADEFGEGMTVVGNEAYVLTWKNNKGHVYDKNSFKLLRSFDYQNSKLGWGLTYDGNQFIKSDGSSTLYFL